VEVYIATVDLLLNEVKHDNDNQHHDIFAGGIAGYSINSRITECASYGYIKLDLDGNRDTGETRTGGIVGGAYSSTIDLNTNYSELYSRGFHANSGGIAGGMYLSFFNDNTNNGTYYATKGGWIFGTTDSGDIYAEERSSVKTFE